MDHRLRRKDRVAICWSTRRRILRLPLLGSLLFLTNVVYAVTTVTIQYALPDFGMKLIVLDSTEINVAEFEERLELVAMEYLDDFLRSKLPEQAPPLSISRDSFRSTSISGSLERFPVDAEETEGVPLAVLRAGLEGIGNFEYSDEAMENSSIDKKVIQPDTHLRNYLQDAFAQDTGFWNFVSKIQEDEILGVTGKLQIAVGTLIVAEGSLVGEQQDGEDYDEEVEPSRGLSKGGIAGICIAAMVLAFGFVWALLLLRQYRKDRALERQKLQRRREAKQQREKLIKDFNKKEFSSSQSVTSMSSGSEDQYQSSYKIKQFSTVPNRSYPNRPPPKGRVRTRPSVQARKSSESLLHMIIEEADDETSHRHTSHEETDDVENVFCSTQSSEHFRRNDARTTNVKVHINNDSSWRGSFSSLGDSANSLGQILSFNDSSKLPAPVVGQFQRRDSFSANSLASNTKSAPLATTKDFIKKQGGVMPVADRSHAQSLFSGSFGSLNKSIADGFGSFNSSVSDDSITQTSTPLLHNKTAFMDKDNHNSMGSISTVCSSQQDVFKVMNQDGFDTLNPDACDFEGSDISMGLADDELSGSFNLADSANFQQFGDVDFASPEDYELKMNRSAELS